MKYLIPLICTAVLLSCSNRAENKTHLKSDKPDSIDSSFWMADKLVINQDTFNAVSTVGLLVSFGNNYLLIAKAVSDSIYLNRSSDVVWRPINDTIMYCLTRLDQNPEIINSRSEVYRKIPVFNSKMLSEGINQEKCRIQNAYFYCEESFFVAQMLQYFKISNPKEKI